MRRAREDVAHGRRQRAEELAEGAVVHVVAPTVDPALEALAEAGRITLDRRPFLATDVDGCWVAFAACIALLKPLGFMLAFALLTWFVVARMYGQAQRKAIALGVAAQRAWVGGIEIAARGALLERGGGRRKRIGERLQQGLAFF